MIAFRVELWCNGPACSARCRNGIVHDDHNELPNLSRNLIEKAKADGWTIDGAAHWCPQCTRVRTANGNGKLGSAA